MYVNMYVHDLILFINASIRTVHVFTRTACVCVLWPVLPHTQNEADINAVDFKGNTPLHNATR